MQNDKNLRSSTLDFAELPTPTPGYRNQKNNSNIPASPRLRSSGSYRLSHRELAVSGGRMRRRNTSKEVLIRALTPPVHRRSSNRRCRNFRPSPSRLSRMSASTEEN
ncbi:hypothetical protein ACHQM5_003011 [Ranunculus cassubicifolius]